jgi:hypothetical protein
MLFDSSATASFVQTDTASVLQEASGYIKFLHEQIQVLVGNDFFFLKYYLPHEVIFVFFFFDFYLFICVFNLQVLSSPYLRSSIPGNVEVRYYYYFFLYFLSFIFFLSFCRACS